MVRIEYTPIEIRHMAYALYVRDWVITHDDGMSVCYNEFVDNEYGDCQEEITQLFQDYGLADWIPFYEFELSINYK